MSRSFKLVDALTKSSSRDQRHCRHFRSDKLHILEPAGTTRAWLRSGDTPILHRPVNFRFPALVRQFQPSSTFSPVVEVVSLATHRSRGDLAGFAMRDHRD
ncbi:hypothetical protein ElyMa_005735200 [Elysia marginata]|uniref:Uncharacterized protein n=1 Tax=Elysia marginata TaxID=1093978 RepID=A0AAV4FKZ0_9GAST|nr:hypothetical protein ElyMa_005735200 [Elysia marginata]